MLISSVVPYMLKTPDNPAGTPKSTFDEMTKACRKTGRSSSPVFSSKAKLEAMKNFDASRWGHLNDLNRDEFVNRPVVKR